MLTDGKPSPRGWASGPQRRVARGSKTVGPSSRLSAVDQGSANSRAMQGRANLPYMRSGVTYPNNSHGFSNNNPSYAPSRTSTHLASSIRRASPSRVLVDDSQPSTTRQISAAVPFTSPAKRLPSVKNAGKPHTIIPLKRTLSSQILDAAPQGEKSTEKTKRKKGETPVQLPLPIRMEHAENGKWDKLHWVATPVQENPEARARTLVCAPVAGEKNSNNVDHQHHQAPASEDHIADKNIHVPIPIRASLPHDQARFLAHYTPVPHEQQGYTLSAPRHHSFVNNSSPRSRYFDASHPLFQSSRPLHATDHDRNRDRVTSPISHKSQTYIHRTRHEPLFLSVSDEEEEPVEYRPETYYTRPQTRRGDIADPHGDVGFHSASGGTPPEPPSAQKPRTHAIHYGPSLNNDPFSYMHEGKYAGNVTEPTFGYPRAQRYTISDTDDSDTPNEPVSDTRHQKTAWPEGGMRKVQTFSKRLPNIYAQPRNQAAQPLDDGLSYTYPRSRVPRRVPTKSTESEYPQSDIIPNFEHGHDYSDKETDDDPMLFPSAHHSRSRSMTENSGYGGTQESQWMRTMRGRSSPTPYSFLHPVSRHQHIRHDENFPSPQCSYQFVGRGIRVAPRPLRRRQRAPRIGPQGPRPKLKMTRRADGGEDIDEYVGAATRPIAEREARRAKAANGNLVPGEHAKKRRSGALVALESIPEGIIKVIDTVKYDQAQELLKERCHREDMTINSGLVRAGEKSMRQAVLNQAARRSAPTRSRQTRAQIIRLEDSPSQDISQFTPSAEYRPPVPTKPMHRRVGQLRFTARTPPLTPPRQPQVRTPGMTTVIIVDPVPKPRDSVTQSNAGPSQGPSTQSDNIQPADEAERLGPNLVKARAERVKQQLLDRASAERQAQIDAVMKAVSHSEQDLNHHQDLERENSPELPVQVHEAAHNPQEQTISGPDQVTTPSQAQRNEDIQDILDCMENNSQRGTQRESSLDRDLSKITASQAQRFIDEMGVDDEAADYKIPSKVAQSTDVAEKEDSVKNADPAMSGYDSRLVGQVAAGPSRIAIPNVPKPQAPARLHTRVAQKRLPLANIPVRGGMSGVDLTDYLVRMLQAPAPAQETTRQLKNRRRALRIGQKNQNGDLPPDKNAPPLNKWPLAVPSTQSSANIQDDRNPRASWSTKVAPVEQLGQSMHEGPSPCLHELSPEKSISRRGTSHHLSLSTSPSKSSSAAVSEAAQESSGNELEPPLGQIPRRLSPTQINTPDPPLQNGIRPFWSRKAIPAQDTNIQPKSPGWKDVEQSRQILSQPFRNPTRGHVSVSQDLKQYGPAQAVKSAPLPRSSQCPRAAGSCRDKFIPAPTVSLSQDGSILYEETDDEENANGIFTGYNVSHGGPFELPRPNLARSQSFKPPLRISTTSR